MKNTHEPRMYAVHNCNGTTTAVTKIMDERKPMALAGFVGPSASTGVGNTHSKSSREWAFERSGAHRESTGSECQRLLRCLFHTCSLAGVSPCRDARALGHWAQIWKTHDHHTGSAEPSLEFRKALAWRIGFNETRRRNLRPHTTPSCEAVPLDIPGA